MKNRTLLVILAIISIACLLFSPGILCDSIALSLFELAVFLILMGLIRSAAQLSPENPRHFNFLLRAPPINVVH